MILGTRNSFLNVYFSGGNLPPDNGYGLLSLTTTHSGTFQANTVSKTGAPLRWWWGDGTYTDGNNPTKVYPNNSEKTIYIATTDGWSGLTEFSGHSLSITNFVVSVATAITHLYLYNNNLTAPPDVSTNTSLILLSSGTNNLKTPPDVSTNTSLQNLYLNNNNLTTPPDISTNTSLLFLYLYNNNLTTPPDTSNNTALTRLWLYTNSLDAAGLSAVIDDCYVNRVVLGGNACNIQIQDNAEPPNPETIAKIEGTGVYAGDGLKDNGCSVLY